MQMETYGQPERSCPFIYLFALKRSPGAVMLRWLIDWLLFYSFFQIAGTIWLIDD